MRVVRVRLVGRNKYGSLVFDHLGCSNAIAREKLTSDVAMQAFWHGVNEGLSERGVYIVGTDLESKAWANICRGS